MELDCFHWMDFAYQGMHPPVKLTAMVSASDSAQTNETWLIDQEDTNHITFLGSLSKI